MKIAKLAAVAVVMAVGLSGCATQKEWAAMGGSRADGVVRLVFTYGGFERPQLDENQAVSTATAKCRTWGYTGAEAFGAAVQQCTASNMYGCVAYQVTKEYQCTGLGDSHAAAGAP